MHDLVLVLGNKNLSSWSLRPWLLLRHAGIPFEEHVFLFEEPGWREKIVALSPSRRVPALRHRHRDPRGADDLLVWDSLAICEYAAELFPEARLWPDDRAARAIARATSAEMHSAFANLRHEMSMDVTARVPRRAPSSETQTDIDRIQQLWGECRARFGAEGPFLFGRFSVADAMFAPVVWRFRTYDVPISSAARSWYETMLALPAMKEWERDAEAEVRAAAALASKPGLPDPTSAQHCYAAIFSSQVATADGTLPDGYEAMAQAMAELARNEPGFLGIESARGKDGFGITVSYWESLEAISRWKANASHQRAQSRGRESFYSRYEIRICNVERGYKHPA
jgi:glutathione S-transferase